MIIMMIRFIKKNKEIQNRVNLMISGEIVLTIKLKLNKKKPILIIKLMTGDFQTMKMN